MKDFVLQFLAERVAPTFWLIQYDTRRMKLKGNASFSKRISCVHMPAFNDTFDNCLRRTAAEACDSGQFDGSHFI